MRKLLLVCALGAIGCAPNVGPEGLLIGGPCFDDTFCVTGAYCLDDPDFPEGTCTTVCADDGDCRGSAVCVERGAGLCLLPCEVDADCGRDGYRCNDEVRRGAAGTVLACSGS